MSAPPEIGVMPRVAATEIQVWWSPPVQNDLAVVVGNNWGSSVCIATSTDGITWTDASNNPFTFTYGIAYSPSGNQWVAVGSYGYSSGERMCIATSTDGMTWTDSSNNPFLIAYGIGWSESLSQWVAVGRNEAQTVGITTSPDGMTWTDASNNPFSGGDGYGIAWSSELSKWVAVGYNSGRSVCIASSPDGMTWTDSSNNPFSLGQANDIAYSQNKWVAVGFNVGYTVSIATSSDGMTWTDASNNPFSGGYGHGIAYSPSQNKWVVVGTDLDNTVCIATSPDGMTWTDSSNNPFSGGYVNGIAYSSSGNYWVAVGRNSDGTVCVARSTDGITWTDSAYPFSGEFGGDANGIAFSSSPPVTNYVIQKAVPFMGTDFQTGQLLYSGDGVNWFVNNRSLPILGTPFAYGNGMWLASGYSSIGQIYYSSDGLTWKSSLTFPIVYSRNHLVYKGGLWLASVWSNTFNICYSTDGLIWNTATAPLGLDGCSFIDYGKDNNGNNIWVAVGNTLIAYSTDGINWNAATNNSAIQFGGSVIYGKDASDNSLWVVVSGLNPGNLDLSYSYNGSIWYYNENGSEDISPDYAYSMAYANGLWLIGCQKIVNVLYYSHDGLRWTPATTANPFLNQCLSIVYAGKWIASGSVINDVGVIYSADGVTWYASSEPFTNTRIALAYGDTNPIIIPAAESKGTYTVTGLTPLTDYTYMIQADCSGSYSDIAVYRTVKTSGRPQPVTGLTKTQSIVDGQLRVTFNFTNPSDYAQYYVYGLRVKGESDAIYEGQDITTIGNSYTFTVDPTREYTFHIQRGNDAGYSSMVSIDTVATTFDPRSFPGLWLWLDANDVGNGVPVPVDIEFSVWKDKSGKENDAVLGAGAAPASVTDAGLGKHVSIGSTWFNLTKSSWAYNQYFTFFVVENASTSSSEIIYIGNRNNGADKIRIGYTNDGSVIFSTYADNTTLGSTTAISNAPPMNVMCFTNYGGKIAYWNKSVSGKNTNAADSFIVDSLLTIGVPTNVGRSEVYEVLMYRGIMKEDDREAITNYLYDKWIPRPSTVIQGPVQNGMIMWLDAADKDTMKDASGASVVADGDSIAQWNDKSGQGNHMYDATVVSQYNLASGFPLFAAGANVSTANIVQTNDATVFLVIFTVDDEYNARTIFTHDVSGNYGLILKSTGKLSWRSGPSVNNNEFKIIAERFFLFYGTIKKGQLLSGTFIDQDGVQKVYSTDSFSYSMGSFPIQLTNVAARAVRYGEVIYYNRVLSDSELQVNAEYLANKWGLIDYLAVAPSAPRLPGLQLWLDSSDPYTVFKTGSTVTAWHDKSGLENNAVAYGAPTVGGGITFHGSDYFSLPDGALPRGDYSYYIVSDFSADSAIVSGGAKDVVGMWVAVGNNSEGTVSIATSPNGMTWTPSSNNPFSGGYANGIAYSQNKWVALGYNLTQPVSIATSPDGMTWTDASNNPFTGATGRGIVYSSSLNKWVAVGGNSEGTVSIATSTDGITWIDASNNPFSGGRGEGITYSSSQNQLVAVGSSLYGIVCIATSTDGITWTDASNNPFSGGQGLGIAWNGSKWVAVGANSGSTVCIASSPDGMTWEPSINNPFSDWSCTGIAWSGSLWMAIGNGPIGIATSSDGMNWTPTPTNPYSGGGAPYGIAWSESESYWTMVGNPGDNGTIFTSIDGITWAESSTGFVCYGIAYGEGDPHALNMSINVITDSSGTFAQTVYDYSSYRRLWVNASLNYSYDSVTWYDASGGNQPHNSIFYANGLWVAVGGYGYSYVYSNDGINWVNPGVGTNGFSADKAYAIVYANGLWIAGGTYTEGGSPITYSSNGINWNAATISDLRTCNSIAYGKDSSGNDLWIAGGDNVEDPVSYPLHYSANGMTWQTVSGSDALIDNCAAVVYGKGIWLAGGEGANTMIYSLTGYNWIPDISGSALMLGACNSIALGKDLSGVELFVASGGTNGEYLAYSYNGLAWQTCIHDISLNTFGNVSYSNGLWLCPADPTLAISYDGITWISSGVQNFAFTVIAGGRGAITENKNILTDTNAIPHELQMGWVAVGANEYGSVCIIISPDGMTWKPSFNNPFSGAQANGIAYSPVLSQWVAVGYDSSGTVHIARSSDGITWTPSSNNPFIGGNGQGIAYSVDKWVAVGNNSISTVCIAISSDGITWNPSSNNPFSGGNGIEIEYNGYYWVAVGANSENTVCIATSPDGMTWTDASNNPFSNGYGYGIAWSSSQNKWVAVGYNSAATVCIATSPDGMTWTDSSNNPFSGGSGRGIEYNGSYWVAVGYNGGQTVCIATSPDGMTWTDASNNPFSGGYGLGIAYSANRWVAVGYNSSQTVSIATSPDGMTWTHASNDPFSVGYGIASGMISLPVSKTVIIESIVDGTNRAMFLSGLTGSTDSAPHVQDSTQNYIGWDLSGGYMNGAIKEMLVYNSPHDSDTRLQVEQYLKNKWFPNAFKPTDISGASLWLDASEENFIYGSKDRIQTWKDKTGNCVVKQNLPWAQPIYSLDSVTGLRGVQFGADAIANGLIDISGSPFGSGNSWSVFTVHRYDYSTDILEESVNGNVCTVYESVGAPTAFKVGSTFVTLEAGVVPSELNLTEGSSVSISADIRKRPVMTGQVVNSLTPAHTVNGLDYPAGGLIVAVGSSTVCIATSMDGITWTDSSNNPFDGGTGVGIAFNGTYWVAVGNSGSAICIAKSADGMTWTDSENNPFSGGSGHAIASNGIYWVAVGQNSDQTVSIARSTDGMTWTESENPFSGGVGLGIAWSSSQNKWVAVGYNSGSTVCIATSPDGMTWEPSINNPFSGGFGIAYSPSQNKWVAVGGNSTQTVSIATSPDGMTWTDSSNNPFSTGLGSGIAYSSSQDKWVAVGRNVDYTVCIATSTDGMTWTDSSNNPFIVAYAVTWSSSINQWVAVGQSSDSTVSIATSPDGMTWTDASNNPFSGGDAYGVAASPPPSIQPMANARMNIGFTAPLTPSLGGAMRGYIYEILCYRGAVSPSDQQKIEGYLAWKWGIQDSLPGTHPYYLGPP